MILKSITKLVNLKIENTIEINVKCNEILLSLNDDILRLNIDFNKIPMTIL